MERIYKALIFFKIIIFASSYSYAQDSLYYVAYEEISRMLEGKDPLSIRRAVFLAEWAYLDGNLDYEKDFCRPIKEGVEFMNKFIAVNKIDSYKTAKQMALCEFFFQPWSGNNYTPFTYDMGVEIDQSDWRQQFVSRTLKTHKGQCRSLPWAMKLYAEELGAEIYINHAPGHCYITYPDLDDRFPEDTVNVEVTTHQYFPSWSLKEQFSISDSAVVVGTYMTPQTDMQTVANQLADLAFGYHEKYKRYDWFTLVCASKSLEYYPMNPNAIIIKSKTFESFLRSRLYFTEGFADDYTDYLDAQILQCRKDLAATHFTFITEEMDEKLRTIPEDYNPIIITK